MATKMVIYRADGTPVVRMTPWQRVKLGLAGAAGALLLGAFVVAALVVGFVIALPIVLLALAFLARFAWQLRDSLRRIDRGRP